MSPPAALKSRCHLPLPAPASTPPHPSVRVFFACIIIALLDGVIRLELLPPLSRKGTLV